ncbi:hypothetical protein BsWGS_05246 [Bradybaena similaris]
MDHEVKHDAAVKDGCQITNVHINNKFSIHEDVVNCENKIHNAVEVRVEVDEVQAARDFSDVGTEDEVKKIETLLSLETQSLSSEPYQCDSVGLDDKSLSGEASLTETREEERDQCKAKTCQTEETGELDEGQSKSTETHESMEDESKRAEIQQTKESAAIDKDTWNHAVESGEMEEDQSGCAVAEIIKIKEFEDVGKEGHCENAEIHETEEYEVGRRSFFVETNQIEECMKGSDEVKVQSNEDEEVKQTDEVRNNDKDEQDGKVTDTINEKDEEIKHGDEVKSLSIEKDVNSKKRALNEIESDLQTLSEDSQSAVFNMFKKRKKTNNKMKEKDCDEGQEREPCSHPALNDSGHQKQPGESTTVRELPCLLESSSHQPRPPAPSQWDSNLRPSPNSDPVMETLQSGPGRPPNRQIMEPHMEPPIQLIESHGTRPGIEPPLPDIGLPESGTEPPGPGMEPPGPNMDSLEMGGSDRRSLGMSPQSQEKMKQPEVVEEKKDEPKPEQKPVNKPKPVASTPIPGTVWSVIRTDDGKCFFYDPSKRRSVWKRPEELKNRPDVDKLLSIKTDVNTEKVEVGDVQEEPPSKKLRSEAEVKEVTEESNHEVTQQIVLGEEDAILPGDQTPQHSSVVPKEVGAEKNVKNDFMKMLSEIPDINQHTTWSDVDIKVSSDPRYKAVDSDSQREDLFREYLRTVNDVGKNDFMKKLSEIPGISNSTTWKDVKSKVSSDPELFSYSHRNNWFREYFKILTDGKKDFMKKLSEIPGINHSTTWSAVQSQVSSDSQYEALFGDSHREDWFKEYLKSLNNVKKYFMARLNKLRFINNSTTWNDVKTKVSSQQMALLSDYHQERWFKEYLQILNKVKNDFMARLIELPSINNSTTWSDVKTKVGSDPQYKAYLNDYHRENWFKEYLQFLNDVKSDFTKRLSEIPGIENSTSWSDMKKVVDSFPDYEAFFSNSHLEDWFTEYLNTVNDVKNDFMKILSEMPGISHWTTWIDIKSKVNADPQCKALISDSHREDWFKEYLKTLNDVKNDFMKQLSKIPDINHSTTWSDVKSKVISCGLRYEALISDSHREHWFEDYLRILNNAKNDFMERLSKIHSISIRSTWKDVESKMNSDSHYDAFVSNFHREDWFREYLKNLNEKIEQDKLRYSSRAMLESRKKQREEALRDFEPFIAEKITDPGCSFGTFKSICDRDFKLTSLITGLEMQHFFTSHIDKLTKRKQEMVKDDFMKMLNEIPDINLSATWSNVKCKVSSDPRYEAVVSDSHREDWFREYLKNQIDMVKNDFMKQLSEIPGINDSTIWNDVKNKVSSDPRYEASVSESHREDWFKEYLKTQHDMVKNDFMKTLGEIPGINCSTTLSEVKSHMSSNPHYEAFVSDSQREAWIQEYVKIVNDTKNDFIKILSETPGINHFTTWSYIKSQLSSDPQYKSVVSDSQRENWFKEYLKTLNDARNNFMKKLNEIPGINNSTTWEDVESKVNSDACYEALFGNIHRENWFMEYVNILTFVKKNFMKSLRKMPGINNSTTWNDVKTKLSSDPRYEAVVSDSHRENWFREYLKILNDNCGFATIGKDMDTAKDDRFLQCRSPYSDISDRSISDKSDDEQKLTVEMEEVSSDEDIGPDEKEIEDEAVKTFTPSVHESDSNDSRIQSLSVVSSLEGTSLVTTQFSSVTVPNVGNSLKDIKRSSRAAPFSLSHNEDRASQRSHGAMSNHQSLSQEQKKIIKYHIKDSATEEGEMAGPKKPVDVIGEMELEPVSDEDSSLDNVSADGEKEGEDVSDTEEDKSSLVNFFVSPSKTRNDVSKHDETSVEAQAISDSDESAKATEKKKDGTANRKLADFGEAERRTRESRPFHPDAQQDRERSSRGLTASSHPPPATSRGVYTSW